MQPSSEQQKVRLDLFAVPALFVFLLFLALTVSVKTADHLMSIQAATFMVGFGLAILWMVRRYAEGIPAADNAACA